MLIHVFVYHLVVSLGFNCILDSWSQYCKTALIITGQNNEFLLLISITNLP